MLIASATQKMIEFYQGSCHDINHFLKVWAFAKTIGELEGLDSHTQTVLELTALVHDIACPLCREKYGNASGKHQEQESAPLVEAFLEDTGVDEAMKERISYLVCHHHTYADVDGMDYQILLEADFLVNADESQMSEAAIRHARETFFKTRTGTELLDSIFL